MPPLTNFPQGVTSFGAPVLPSGLPGLGNIFFVSSTRGAAGNDGLSPTSALSTIDAAINLCTANNGDVIYVMSNHAETISNATSIVPDVAGVTIIGIGSGANRPTITFDNTASQIIFSAADNSIQNFVFECGVDSLVAALSVTGSGVSILGCDFSATTTAQNPLLWVLTTAAADFLSIIGCRTPGLGNFEAGPAAVIRIIGGDDCIIRDNWFTSNSSVAIIDNPTTACLRLEISNNILLQYNTTIDLAIDLFATTEGHIQFNNGRNGDGTPASAAIDPGDCTMAENHFANLDGETGALAGVVST